MEDMTPEERFTLIENLLRKVKENQIKRTEEIEKRDPAIRDLIVDSRMLLEGLPGSAAKSGKQLGPGDELLASIKDVRKAQQVTDKKLRKLVERVDRMIRRRNK